ncbi:ABC-2 family transporter protein [Pseudobythopirellula maris]|uniref:ABC-2 family transporter protein n=1 Tax=Pseudobythopirellula maris TaxID=2527991 RepID=A0A5C5ZHS9_9BACT|nr:ABC transporter permease subunit [Pseudobythopirellula maris]TWT86547.1 ABC-2 family transporter protein [Pseudobythopirellula maris]
MFVGPVFTREAVTAPRRLPFFVYRALFVAALLGLALTAWQILLGAQQVSGPAALSRFGEAVFRLLTPLQLTVSVLFSALLSAAAVSQEKDKKTLILLLLTDLRNSELVLGRLLASLLTVLVVTLATLPFFLMMALLGGVSHAQIGRAMAIVVVSSLAAGSLGSTVALWREKTFQALAITALVLVTWVVGWEVVGAGAVGETIGPWRADRLAAVMSPWRALAEACEPRLGAASGSEIVPLGEADLRDGATGAVGGFIVAASLAVVALNLFAVLMVRVWNPSREARPQSPQSEPHSNPSESETRPHSGAQGWSADQDTIRPERDARVERAVAAVTSEAVTGAATGRSARVGEARGQQREVHAAPGAARQVWDNPILWRETRTWAYGKKVLVVKLAYVAIFVLCAVATAAATRDDTGGGAIPAAAQPMAPLLVVSLVLINALSVTSITNERDGKSLDLLLTTDLTPKELIFGKLGGVFWNAREMVVLPLALCAYLWWFGALTGWTASLLVVGLLVMDVFAAVLGLHAGMMYFSSRQAIGASIGTLLFLFIGVSTCMRMMLALSDSFESQLAPFLGFIFGGGVGLYAALGWRNPSSALALASFAAPFATFYAIVSFLIGDYSLVAAATVATFGFATAAMLVPALSEFDIATGAGPKES